MPRVSKQFFANMRRDAELIEWATATLVVLVFSGLAVGTGVVEAARLVTRVLALATGS
jgi:hypothetical protein